MYSVEILTRREYERGFKIPKVYEDIRNISITSGRFLITDGNNHMLTYRPDEVLSFSVWKQKEG